MRAVQILLFGVLSQAVLCLAIISLFDGGSFTTSEEVSGRQQQLPPGVGGGQARPGDGRGITPAVTFQSILRYGLVTGELQCLPGSHRHQHQPATTSHHQTRLPDIGAAAGRPPDTQIPSPPTTTPPSHTNTPRGALDLIGETNQEESEPVVSASDPPSLPHRPQEAVDVDRVKEGVVVDLSGPTQQAAQTKDPPSQQQQQQNKQQQQQQQEGSKSQQQPEQQQKQHQQQSVESSDKGVQTTFDERPNSSVKKDVPSAPLATGEAAADSNSGTDKETGAGGGGGGKDEGQHLPVEGAVEEEPLDPEAGRGEAPSKNIVSFSEWAEKQDAAAVVPARETDNIDTPKSPPKSGNQKTTSAKLNKNFASPDCTAKITGANPESQGSGNVISSSRDEYLLNKCSDRAFFVIELCESIKALKVQIANFELYSSSPKEFRVWIGNGYPGRDKDWSEFGTFTYEDERSIQTFKNEAGVLGKFAKVEILSHHGTEHYCPISLFRVYGIPEIDLISGEVEDTDEDDEEAGGLEEDKGNENPIVKGVKTIGDAFVTAIRNVVFKPPQAGPEALTVSLLHNDSSLFGTSMRHVVRTSTKEMSQERSDMITYLLSTQYNTLRRYLSTMSVSAVLLEHCCEYGFSLNNGPGTANQAWRWLDFLRVVHGDDFILALCNVLSIELGLSDLAMLRSWEESTTDFILVNPVTNNANNTSTSPFNPETEVSSQAKQPRPPTAEETSPTPTNNKTGVNRAEAEKVEELGEPGEDKKREKEAGSIPSTAPGAKENMNQPKEKERPAGTSGGAATAAPAQVVPPAAAPTPAAANSGGGGAARETTWQKLSNRIRSLERNVSLSTGFLEELSLKYIKQIDELNSATKMMSESISQLSRREEACRAKSSVLEKQVESLQQGLNDLERKLSESSEEMMSRHGLLVVLEVCLLALLLFWCAPSKKTQRLAVNPATQARRLSLDAQREEKLKQAGKAGGGGEEGQGPGDRRRKSIEVGSLVNGQVGSMIEPLTTESSANEKAARKRRKKKKGVSPGGGGRQVNGVVMLRHVEEEEDEEEEGNVYLTYQGRKVQQNGLGRKRSNSWSQDLDVQENNIEEVFNQVFEPAQMVDDESWSAVPVQPMPRNKLWENHVNDVIKSTRFLVSQVTNGVVDPRSEPHQHYYNLSRSSSRALERSPIKVSNIFEHLDRSVHEIDTETDATDNESPREPKMNGVKESKKITRSKSTSPTRHANMLRKQKVMFKNFRPEEAEWLQ